MNSKWVFRVLRDQKGKSLRYKARRCARGFSQIEGLNYTETFSVIIYDSLRIFLALRTQLDLEITQFDVETAFLYADLKEDITMEVPVGMNNKGNAENVV